MNGGSRLHHPALLGGVDAGHGLDEARLPALRLVIARLSFVHDLDLSQPLDAHLSIRTRDEQTKRVAVSIRKRPAVHQPSEKRSVRHGGLKGCRVHIAVHGAKGDTRGAGHRSRRLEQRPKRDAVPCRIADQPPADPVADAFQCRLLSRAVRQTRQVREPVDLRMGDLSCHLQAPGRLEDGRVDEVLRHRVEALRRRQRLHRTVVSHAVVAEGAVFVEKRRHPGGPDREDARDHSKHQAAPGLVGLGSGGWPGTRPPKREMENGHVDGELEQESDGGGGRSRHRTEAEVACRKHRP